MSTLSGIRDTDKEILLRLDYESLLNACATDTYIRSFCTNDYFWKDKLEYDFGASESANKPTGMTYRKYFEQVYYGADPMLAFSGNPKMDMNILSRLNLEQLRTMCSLNTYFINLCNSDGFWQRKVYYDFGEEVAQLKPAQIRYKEQYMQLVHTPKIKDVVANDRWDILLNLLRTGSIPKGHVYYTALTMGKLPMLQWLKDQGYPINADSANIAAKLGYLDILDWLFEQGIVPSQRQDLPDFVMDWMEAHGFMSSEYTEQELYWLGQ